MEIFTGNNQTQMIEEVKGSILKKFPLVGVTMSKLKFVPSNRFKTAATDGECVYYSPKFVQPLSSAQREFLFSHEIMHVAFKHIERSENKNKQVWNEATDAVINQILINEKLPMIEGGVDIAEALEKSAEEMYEKLLKQKQQQQQNGQSNSQSKQTKNNQAGHDDHTVWDKALEKAKKQQQKQEKEKQKQSGQNKEQKQSQPENSDESKQKDGGQSSPQKQNGESSSSKNQEQGEGNQTENASDKNQSGGSTSQNSAKQNEQGGQKNQNGNRSNDLERDFVDANQKLKQEIAKKIIEDLKRQKNNISKSNATEFGALGTSPAVVSWKKILKRELEKEEDRWTYRRADEDNDYMARIGELEVEDYPETEVMLDVSGSIDDEFLKGFLRQLKPLLKESKLRVGCFDEYFYGLVDIKSDKDIDNFKVKRESAWTENWDLAVKSFSKKRGVNKIVFTDGMPCPGVMPTPETKNINVIWLVFKNKNFKPCCGKVIFIDRRELNKMMPKEDFMERG